MNQPVQIILADDHKMFLEGLYALLYDDKRFHILATAKNGKEVLKLLTKYKAVDLLITDISMPEIDGIQLNKIVKKKYPQIKVIVLSMHKQNNLIAKLINDDVDGYLLKNADIDELSSAIDKVAKGNKYFSKDIRQDFMKSMFSPKAVKQSFAKLSKREKEILILIANEYTNAEIAEKLFISQFTAETHRKNILRKIDAKNTAGIVRYAIQHGLI
ncbi:MAG TPA: response regulator transcription factor [Flavobacteriia bacterium]|jgi:DNA-binding NarL/FixJ family response regulator|nr:response regulator transcription factor [Flavobacteriia bacterium]